MKFYKQASKIKNGAPTSEVGLTKAGEIIVGKFVDRERPTRLITDLMHDQLADALRRYDHVESGGMRMPELTEIRVAGFRRPGSHPVGHCHRQGRLHLSKAALPP